MKVNFKVLFINISVIFIFLLIIFSLLYLFNGSLEKYPTDEQISKVNISMGFIVFILVILELYLMFIRKKLNQIDKTKTQNNEYISTSI
jgi:uncharacterized protein YpmB